MSDTQQSGTSSDPNVFNQLEQIASERGTNPRASHRGRRGAWHRQTGEDNRSYPPSNLGSQNPTRSVPRVSERPVGAPAWTNQPPIRTTDSTSFPPLGSHHSTPAQPGPRYYQPFQHQPPQPQSTQHHPPQQQAFYHNQNIRQQPTTMNNNNFSDRPRGGAYRGGRQRTNYTSGYPQRHHQQHQTDANSFQRPAPAQSRLYTPNNAAQSGTTSQQREHRLRIMTQSDFLESLATTALRNQITPEEFQAKEAFRRIIQTMARDELRKQHPKGLNFSIEHVKLKLYGSLGSGFGVAGSDMDLLLTFPQDEGSLDGIEIESRRLLEKAILDAGYGARLLTNTRVPILKVCEKPSPELLQNLRETRQQWEATENDQSQTQDTGYDGLPALPTQAAEAAHAVNALAELSIEAAGIPLPSSPVQAAPKLEFVGDCGIQCDINFTNYVAFRNTELLRTYGTLDPRVRQVGLFVKYWTKARDINTPYRGTLSSYGYILMVLHYLLNVVQPPIIPNLQAIARDGTPWSAPSNPDLVDGFDVRFVRSPQQLERIMASMPRNHESVGALLRGFFWYYATGQGFHWTKDVISIRTAGGRLSKEAKGWTGAKWQEGSQHVRLRYLLAIEDPFEVEHNVARTVGHSGIVAIRDEFRRAWTRIEHVQFDESMRSYFWINRGEREAADDFMTAAESRGDLLRKDQEAHRDKLRRMRQDLEAKEEALRTTSLEGSVTNGTWTAASSEQASQSGILQSLDHPSQALIHNRSSQDKRREWKAQSSRRQTRPESDDDETESQSQSAGSHMWHDSTQRRDESSSTTSMWFNLTDSTSPTELSGLTSGQTGQAYSSEWQGIQDDAWDEDKPGCGLSQEVTDAKFAMWDAPQTDSNVGGNEKVTLNTPINEDQHIAAQEEASADVAHDSWHDSPREEFAEPLQRATQVEPQVLWHDPQQAVPSEPLQHIPQDDTKNLWHDPHQDISVDRPEHAPLDDSRSLWHDPHRNVSSEPLQHVAQANANSLWHDPHQSIPQVGVQDQQQSNWCVPEVNPVSRGATSEQESAANDRSSSIDLEIPNQRRNQFDVMGDRVFARDRHVKTYLAPHNRPPRADKQVGSYILWDVGTQGGRWLHWRDGQIQAGTFTTPRSPELADLDQRFPYNPAMSYAELHQINIELRDHYKYGFRRYVPRQSRRQQEEIVQQQQVTPMVPAQLAPVTRSSVSVSSVRSESRGSATKSESIIARPQPQPQPQPVTVPVEHHEIKPAEIPSTTSLSGRRLSTNAEPVIPSATVTAEQLRAIRIKYFENLSAGQDNHGTGTGMTDVPQEQTDRELSKRSATASRLARKDSGTSCMWDNALQADEGKVATTNITGLPTHDDGQALTGDDSISTGEHAASGRITRKPDFNFDPRQLAALEIIRHGGNGCARKGEEFSIEEEYELGGGGAMGCKSSSVPAISAQTASS